jgi:hypothetical protein
VPTDAYRAGTYQFSLDVTTQRGRLYWRSNETLTAQTASIAIHPTPQPEIIAFGPTHSRYSEADSLSSPTRSATHSFPYAPIHLNWAIAHPETLERLVFIGRDADQIPIISPIEFDLRQGIPTELADYCHMDSRLVCWNVPTPAHTAGIYRFELQLFSASDDSDVNESGDTAIATHHTDPIKIERRTVPPAIRLFRVNGESAQAKYVLPLDATEPTPVIPIEWAVEGDDDVIVELLPAPGVVSRRGAIAYPLSPQGSIETLTLRVTNPDGNSITRSVTLETVPPSHSPLP